MLEGKAPQKGQSWASMAAAAAMAQATCSAAQPTQRPTVRVHLANAKGKSPSELLAMVKLVIQGAYAVRPLHSSDIEVVVLDQKAKDQALNQQDAEGCKVLCQDYPVEVPGVPLTLGITNK